MALISHQQPSLLLSFKSDITRDSSQLRKSSPMENLETSRQARLLIRILCIPSNINSLWPRMQQFRVSLSLQNIAYLSMSQTFFRMICRRSLTISAICLRVAIEASRIQHRLITVNTHFHKLFSLQLINSITAHLVAARGKVYITNQRLDMRNLQREFTMRAIKPAIVQNSPMFFV
jgi:hypothetical protein